MASILAATITKARLNQLIVDWGICLGVMAIGVRPTLAKKGRKVGKTPSGVWKSSTTIAATTKVGARLKLKVLRRGVDLCSQPQRR